MNALRAVEDWRKIREAIFVSLIAHVAIILLIALLVRIPLPEINMTATTYEPPVELTLIEQTIPQMEAEQPDMKPTQARFVQLPQGEERLEHEKLQVRELTANFLYEAAREISAASPHRSDGDRTLPSQDGTHDEAIQLTPASQPNSSVQTLPATGLKEHPDGSILTAPEIETLLTPEEFVREENARPDTATTQESSAELAYLNLPHLKLNETDNADTARETLETLPRPVQENNMKTLSAADVATAPTLLQGGIERSGAPGVNAAATVAGAYKQKIVDTIGEEWQRAISRRMSFLQRGTLRVRFSVDANGSMKDLRVVGNSANPIAGTITLNAISGVKLPPIPDAVLATLPSGKMEIEFFFSIGE